MARNRTFDDIDLMHYVDDELDSKAASSLAAHLESETSEDTRAKVRSLEQMSEVLSSYLELEADEVEPRLDAMWETIRERTQAAEPVRQPVRQQASEPETPGIWARIVRFFDGYRGHILTGAVAAGAAAAIILALRPPAPTSATNAEQPVAVQRPTQPIIVPDTEPLATDPDGDATARNTPDGTQDPALRMVNEPSAPEVVEVSGDPGMVFSLPGEDEGDASATVIFLDLNNDVEGPL